MTAFEEIRYDVESGVATVMLDRPAKHNAVTETLRRELFEALDLAVADDDVAVIVLAGAGRDFCVGADVEWLREVSQRVGWAPTFPNHRMREVPKPVVAAVQGICTGLGLVWSAMADIRFVADDVRFVNAFPRRGLVAEGGLSWVLPRLIGQGRASDMLISGREIHADEAMAWGLATHRTSAEDLLAAAQDFAREMAARCAPSSMTAIKYQLSRHGDMEFGDALAETRRLVRFSNESADFQEGLASFREKRAPRFQGLGESWFLREIGTWYSSEN